MRREALSRAVNGRSWVNVPAIVSGFIEKGIPAAEIKPRENVFTYQAWLAIGRQVRRGEHGVRVFTRIPIAEKTDESGRVIRPAGPAARCVTVFHVSQTDPVDGPAGAIAPETALESVAA